MPTTLLRFLRLPLHEGGLNRPLVRWSLAVLALLTSGAFVRPAQALPVFARKYGVQCTLCHTAFPRLNAYGMRFRQNGYRQPGEDGNSPWDDKNFPMAVVANTGLDLASMKVLQEDGSSVRSTTVKYVRNATELHTLGTLAPHVSFHVDGDFSEAGFLSQGQAAIQFDDIAANGALNIRAGLFDSDIPYLASSRITTLHDYVAPVTIDAQGIELNGIGAGWSYAAALVNSERATGKSDSHTLNNFENTYAWVMRDVGKHEVAARIYLDHTDPRTGNASSSLNTQIDVNSMLNIGRAVIIPAYTYQKMGDLTTADKMQTAFLEALVQLDADHKWVVTGRAESQHVSSTTSAPSDNLRVGTVNLAYYLNPNARVGIEYAHSLQTLSKDTADDVQAFVHVVY